MIRRCFLRVCPALLGLTLLAGAMASQGCYHRVVGAKGLGGGAYDVSSPYQENSPVDDWIFGVKPSNDKIERAKQPE